MLGILNFLLHHSSLPCIFQQIWWSFKKKLSTLFVGKSWAWQTVLLNTWFLQTWSFCGLLSRQIWNVWPNFRHASYFGLKTQRFYYIKTHSQHFPFQSKAFRTKFGYKKTKLSSTLSSTRFVGHLLYSL